MKKLRKKVREKGKLKLGRMFHKFKIGENVALVREVSKKSNFPRRLQGKTGIIEEERGRAYIVKIQDMNKEKRFIINPIHLKKITVK